MECEMDQRKVALSLLCLLLIVEVTPHLWLFARLSLSLETQIYEFISN